MFKGTSDANVCQWGEDAKNFMLGLHLTGKCFCHCTIMYALAALESVKPDFESLIVPIIIPQHILLGVIFNNNNNDIVEVDASTKGDEIFMYMPDGENHTFLKDCPFITYDASKRLSKPISTSKFRFLGCLYYNRSNYSTDMMFVTRILHHWYDVPNNVSLALFEGIRDCLLVESLENKRKQHIFPIIQNLFTTSKNNEDRLRHNILREEYNELTLLTSKLAPGGTEEEMEKIVRDWIDKTLLKNEPKEDIIDNLIMMGSHINQNTT